MARMVTRRRIGCRYRRRLAVNPKSTTMAQEIWLICGSRDFADNRMFGDAMRRLVRERGMPECIIHGGQRGADTMAENWCKDMEVDCLRVPGKFTTLGKKAGPIRNNRMIKRWMRPDFVVAFPGGKGTANMVAQASTMGIEVLMIT